MTSGSHDGSKFESFYETEIIGGGEPRAVDPSVHNAEVGGRNQERLLRNSPRSSILPPLVYPLHVYGFTPVAAHRSKDHISVILSINEIKTVAARPREGLELGVRLLILATPFRVNRILLLEQIRGGYSAFYTPSITVRCA
ncbi:hypothetical protein B296_00053084 [Ensete ventricosum]|uniref:Uncharacterized protein n=1 Tax=Ensete ventricosum TaxID=4639 RepID=A0A426XBW7_ENSVE|nr:hypothetical protein B296_00053084 [Ensete ventricosum]